MVPSGPRKDPVRLKCTPSPAGPQRKSGWACPASPRPCRYADNSTAKPTRADRQARAQNRQKFFRSRGTTRGLLGYRSEGRGRNDPPSPHCSCLTRKLDPASWRGFSFRAQALRPGFLVSYYPRTMSVQTTVTSVLATGRSCLGSADYLSAVAKLEKSFLTAVPTA